MTITIITIINPLPSNFTKDGLADSPNLNVCGCSRTNFCLVNQATGHMVLANNGITLIVDKFYIVCMFYNLHLFCHAVKVVTECHTPIIRRKVVAWALKLL